MTLRRIQALTKKEFIQLIRDKHSLGLAVAIPVLLLILFGYALTLDVDHVPLVVWDKNKTLLSREYIRGFINSPYFKLVADVNNYTQAEEKINTNTAIMVLVIPDDFSQKINSGQTLSVQLLLDGSDANTASIALGYAQAINNAYNIQVLKNNMAKNNLFFIEAIQLRPRVWFNQTLKSKNFIVPGLIAIIMMVVTVLLTSGTVSREWERGTMEQLISTPLQAGELIMGKFIPYFCIGFLDVLIAIIMAEFLFHVPFRGNIFILFLLSGLFLTGTLCWGLFISITFRTQFATSLISFLSSFLPSFILSGFAFAIINMPMIIQTITYLIPARYFMVILRSIYLKGAGLSYFRDEIFFLLLYSIITIILSTLNFKKRVA
jgi:ABC-2 type transport system permease protein